MEHNREPGDVEWFIKTHKKKDNTFQEPITLQTVVFEIFCKK